MSRRFKKSGQPSFNWYMPFHGNYLHGVLKKYRVFWCLSCGYIHSCKIIINSLDYLATWIVWFELIFIQNFWVNPLSGRMKVYLSILACPINVNFSQGAFVVTSIKAGLGVINFDTHAATKQRFFRRQFSCFWAFVFVSAPHTHVGRYIRSSMCYTTFFKQ